MLVPGYFSMLQGCGAYHCSRFNCCLSPLKELQPHVSKTNRHLPANSQLHVSLHNGPKTFVITGPPKALFSLVTSLRKIRAQSGLDQSKTPFSQRKPVFLARFLLARPSVPYLALVPISFPLIGLTQLVQYLVVCKIANLTPGELRSRISGATGHS